MDSSKRVLIYPSLLASLAHIETINRGKVPSEPLEFIDSLNRLTILVRSHWLNIPSKTKRYILTRIYNYLDSELTLGSNWYNKFLLFITNRLDLYKVCLSSLDMFIDECLNQVEINNPDYKEELESILEYSIDEINSSESKRVDKGNVYSYLLSILYP